MSMAHELQRRYDRLAGRRDATSGDLTITRRRVSQLKAKADDIQEARLIIQHVAKQTQEELQYQVSTLVTTALQSTFPHPYTFEVVFENKRGKTEAALVFSRDGQQIEPMDGAGGGAVDIAAFALRLVMWSIRQPRCRPLIILDEPFRFLNDATRQLHAAAAAMLKEISSRLGLQVICVTQIPELLEVADACFEVSLVNGTSRIGSVGEQSITRRAGRAKKN